MVVMTDVTVTSDFCDPPDALRGDNDSFSWYPEHDPGDGGPTAGSVTMGMTSYSDPASPTGAMYGSPIGPTQPMYGSPIGPTAPLMDFQGDVKDSSSEPGVVGLRNLGNTCFMNAGVQCLVSNPHLVKFFLEEYSSDVHESLTGRFYELLRKMWTGDYSVIYPAEFKEVLGAYYPQFRDFRQHDCQEFLALLLDSLHEELNKTKKYCDSGEVGEPSCQSAGSSQEKDPNNLLIGQEAGPSQQSGTCSQNLASTSQSQEISDTEGMACSSKTVTDIEMEEEDLHKHRESPTEIIQKVDISDQEVDGEACKAEETTAMLECSDNEDRAMLPNNQVRIKRMPSIEDFYMKDTKTLNTNMVATEESETVTVDSEKFQKPDNSQTSTASEVYDQLQDFILSEVKGGLPIKPLKSTNLLANIKDKFSEDVFAKKCLFSEMMEGRSSEEGSKEELVSETSECGINNIKRMKIDEEEKNIRMQARLKVNTNKNPTKDLNCEDPAPLTVRRKGAGATMCYHDNLSVQHITAAEQAWQKYLNKNQSVVVDTFQGQFRSTVVCSECHHVSVTYEPFMYLSVPLPHAMERQLTVILIASDSRPPVRYMVTLNKQDNIKKLKEKLLELIGEETADIVIAEVLDNHIARILEDNTMLRYINDTYRTLYAFEMMPPPQTEEMISEGVNADSAGFEAASQPINNASHDVFSNIGLFDSSMVDDTTITNNKIVTTPSESKEPQILNNLGDGTSHGWSDAGGFISGVDWTDNLSKNQNSPEPNWADDILDPVRSRSTPSDDITKSCVEESTEDQSGGGEGAVTDQWQSCAICLEEMADNDLLAHGACGGTLCQSCLDMSFKHYGDAALICPVCSSSVDPALDFIQLSAMTNYKPKTRILSVPVVFRYSSAAGVDQLFGHPNLLYLPNQISGEQLYESVDRVVPCFTNYTILLTDGQGYHCSRCMYTAHCSGCEISREAPVSLQPGDHLAVCFEQVSQSQIDSCQQCIQHKSMELLRPDGPLSLFDCLDAFMDSEVLDEHNPWFCPRCQRNQCARKTITVWQYPDTLVVYLKRFVFHELSSTKIDQQVVFPVENLDLSDYISGPSRTDLTYDLQSCVCHFGGVNAGHYTAYSRHPIMSTWNYYNDETTRPQAPLEEDFSNAYVLFYQRTGTNRNFCLPSEDVAGPSSTAPLSIPASPSLYRQSPEPLNNSAISEEKQELDSGDICLGEKESKPENEAANSEA